MAKQKPQTRFVIEIDGKLKRLLSIREASTGDLLITTHLAGLHNFERGNRRIKESRHSLHVSPASEGNTVHGIVVHEDGSRLDRHLVTNAVRDGRFQPIYVR